MRQNCNIKILKLSIKTRNLSKLSILLKIKKNSFHCIFFCTAMFKSIMKLWKHKIEDIDYQELPLFAKNESFINTRSIYKQETSVSFWLSSLWIGIIINFPNNKYFLNNGIFNDSIYDHPFCKCIFLYVKLVI